MCDHLLWTENLFNHAEKGEKISDDFDKDYHLYFIHKNQHDRSV